MVRRDLFLQKNRGGWIRIMEALISILIISAVLLIIVQQDYIKEQDYSQDIYKREVSILRSIRLNDTFRQEIVTSQTPSNWSDASFPQKTKQFIINNTPSYLECEAKLCSVQELCTLYLEPESENFYTRSGFFAITGDTLNPKKMHLYCKIVR